MSKVFITLGALLLIGLAADALGYRTQFPRVTLLLVLGVLVGPSALNLLPQTFQETWFPAITDMALVMVGFLLGEKFAVSFLQRNAQTVFWISVGEVVVTALVLGLGLVLLGVPLEVALILAGAAPASAPAATTDVVREMRGRGKFANTLLAIVAIDDAWGLIIFSFLLAVAQSLQGTGGVMEILVHGGRELGGGLLLGAGLGIPMAYLTGRIRPGEPTLLEALGLVFLCGGMAIWLEVSFILSAMVMGAMVANLARHHERPFHAIENIELPFMILFFILAGASLELDALARVGWLGAAYILLRAGGLILGAWIGGTLSRASSEIKSWIGLALMPQAGVALGMALVAVNRFTEYKDLIFPVVIGATILFELFGPILTRTALIRAGAVPPKA